MKLGIEGKRALVLGALLEVERLSVGGAAPHVPHVVDERLEVALRVERARDEDLVVGARVDRLLERRDLQEPAGREL